VVRVGEGSGTSGAAPRGRLAFDRKETVF
jgi:hypothetical protein